MRLQLVAALAAFVTLAGLSFAHAGELDNEKSVTNQQIQMAKDLPATLVVRVSSADQSVEVLQSPTALAADSATTAQVNQAAFAKLPESGKMAGELDRDSSNSSWYFCYNRYAYPVYYYYGYTYTYATYYSYSYAGYNYYWYRWGYRGYGW